MVSKSGTNGKILKNDVTIAKNYFTETEHLHDYTDDLAPEFLLTPSTFHVVLKI